MPITMYVYLPKPHKWLKIDQMLNLSAIYLFIYNQHIVGQSCDLSFHVFSGRISHFRNGSQGHLFLFVWYHTLCNEPLKMSINQSVCFGEPVMGSPDALVQRAEFSHQLCGSFVLIAAQVVNRLYSLGSWLQLIFIDVNSLILVEKTEGVGRTGVEKE